MFKPLGFGHYRIIILTFIVIELTYHMINWFKIYNSVGFGMPTDLNNNHCSHFRTFLSLHKKSAYTLKQHYLPPSISPHSPPHFSPSQPMCFFLSVWLCLFWDISYKQNNFCVVFYDWLLLLSIIFSKFIQVVACINTWFLLLSNNILLYRYTAFYLSIHQLMPLGLLPLWLLWIILL